MVFNWFKASSDEASEAAPEATRQTQMSPVWSSVDDLIALKSHTRGIQLTSIKPAAAQRAGTLRSRFRGRGMDYLESRNYQPGDDVRHMDWRVTARTGDAHVKVFTEERERPVVLLLDFRQSMFFASRGHFKSVQCARAAALLGWATVARGDRIGAVMLNGGHHEMKPVGGHRGALKLIRELVQRTDPESAMKSAEDHGETLATSLRRLRRIAKPGTLVFLLSDFRDFDAEAEHQLLRLREHNDVAALQFTDRLEQLPLPAGVYGVSNGEEHRFLDLSSSASRSRYLSQVALRQKDLTHRLTRCAVPLITLYTHEDVERKLAEVTGSGLFRGSMKSRAAQHG